MFSSHYFVMTWPYSLSILISNRRSNAGSLVSKLIRILFLLPVITKGHVLWLPFRWIPVLLELLELLCLLISECLHFLIRLEFSGSKATGIKLIATFVSELIMCCLLCRIIPSHAVSIWVFIVIEVGTFTIIRYVLWLSKDTGVNRHLLLGFLLLLQTHTWLFLLHWLSLLL